MSKTKKAFCYLSPLITYAAFAFVLCDINPSNWSEGARAISVITTFCVFVAALTFPEDAFK